MTNSSKNVAGIIIQILSVILGALVLGFMVSKFNFAIIGLIIAVPIAFGILYFLFSHPVNGLWLALVAAFFAIGANRYLPGPLGLSIDFLLVLTILSGIFQINLKPEWYRLKNFLFISTLLWFGYCLLQIINPEARSIEAWFYAVRGVALYMMFAVPLGLLYLRKPEYLNTFLYILLGASLLGFFWGYKQYVLGPDSAEWAWLETGPKKTHILRGKLRVFSFFSDAGQFGASMGHILVICGVLLLGPFSFTKKVMLGIAALLFTYGLLISGTRGALFVPAFGFLGFLITTKNFKLLSIGLIIMGGTYGFLKYTTILNDVAEVRRMRTALDPNDASFQVRLENQRKYKEYLKTRPFGGGIGTAGTWGLRFSPGTFLAETPTDSWYVKIWGETGIIGLSLHLTMLVSIIVLGMRIIWKLKTESLKWKIMAIHSAYIGIVVASYGNPIFGQLPTGIIIYLTWAFVFLAPYYDRILSPTAYESEPVKTARISY